MSDSGEEKGKKWSLLLTPWVARYDLLEILMCSSEKWIALGDAGEQTTEKRS